MTDTTATELEVTYEKSNGVELIKLDGAPVGMVVRTGSDHKKVGSCYRVTLMASGLFVEKSTWGQRAARDFVTEQLTAWKNA